VSEFFVNDDSVPFTYSTPSDVMARMNQYLLGIDPSKGVITIYGKYVKVEGPYLAIKQDVQSILSYSNAMQRTHGKRPPHL